MKGRLTRSARFASATLFGLGLLLWTAPGWGTGAGIQLTLPREDWEATLKELSKAKVEKGAYRIGKRTFTYDFEITVVTPYARAARFVQAAKPGAPPPTYEQVSTAMVPGRLEVELKIKHRSKEAAAGVLLMLAAGEQNIQPYQDKELTTYLKSEGFYAEPFYNVVKSFAFDLAQVPVAQSPEVVIIETNGSFVRVPVRWERLK
jgi:hypothetical protein